jgi:hypothetical protein
MEDRLCPSTTIDAHALILPQVLLDADVISTSTPQTFDLAAGNHSLSGLYGYGGSVAFSVAGDGTVSYDPSLNGILSGLDTTTLVVNGRTVTINATALSLPQLDLDLQIEFASATPLTATVLPGDQYLYAQNGYGGSALFTVNNDGTVSYDASLQGVLTGSGTSNLGVSGRTVTINATALSLPQLDLDLQFSFPSATTLSATVLPGTQYLLSQNSYGGQVFFDVGNDGKVSYDASLQGVLTGSGTTNLGVSGRTITIDAHALSLPQLDLDLQFSFPSATTLSATVLPGTQYLLSQTVYGGQVFFSVGNDGTVSYDASLQGVLTGNGTTNLHVNGATITINATALSLPQLDLDYQIDFASAAPLSATVLPGTQFLYSATGWGGSLFFTVGNNGTLSYDPVLVQTLSGQGTPNLVVNGDTVHINATALNAVASTFTLAGIGSYPITAIPQLTLMPGWENFSTATVAFNFHVDEFSRIDYDPVHDSVVTGRNTDTLMLLPPQGPDHNASRSATWATARDAALPLGRGTPMVTDHTPPASYGPIDAVFAMQSSSMRRASFWMPGLRDVGFDIDPGDALD